MRVPVTMLPSCPLQPLSEASPVGDQRRVVLASASPRRQELAVALGLRFRVMVSCVDETPISGEEPHELVARLSLLKAGAIGDAVSDAIIIAADTIVVIDGRILGKPRDRAEAFEMLSALRNREHSVLSGLAVTAPQTNHQALVVTTPVRMRDYSDRELSHYIETGDPQDKAGGYAIQHAEFEPIARLDGCYANVMGLPMCHLYSVLCAWGVHVPVHPLEGCPYAREHGCDWAQSILSPDMLASGGRR